MRDTILHEMIHYWLWHGSRPYGHTVEFHAKLKATGAKRFNPVPKLRPIKHHYRCRGCGGVVPARRRLEDVACAACCKRFNGGEYSRNYRLELVANPCNSDGDEVSGEGFLLPFDKVVEKLQSIRELLKNATIRR